MRVRKSAEDRKAEIVDAALQLADKLGPESLTTEAIAKAVGLSQPGVFRHFAKKQALWAAVAARIGETMEARWSKTRALGATPVGRLRALIETQLRLIQSTPAIPAILFSRELHAKNKVLRLAFMDLMGRFHREIAEAVAQASELGELRDDLEPNDMAYLIIGLVQGLAVRWSISARGFDLTEEGLRLLDLQLSGFAPARPRARPRRRAS